MPSPIHKLVIKDIVQNFKDIMETNLNGNSSVCSLIEENLSLKKGEKKSSDIIFHKNSILLQFARVRISKSLPRRKAYFRKAKLH